MAALSKTRNQSRPGFSEGNLLLLLYLFRTSVIPRELGQFLRVAADGVHSSDAILR